MDKSGQAEGAVIVLERRGGRVQLAAGVCRCDGRSGRDLVNVAQQVGGKGGGRAWRWRRHDPSRLGTALASVRAWAEQRL
jgi:hypothetical protein